MWACYWPTRTWKRAASEKGLETSCMADAQIGIHNPIRHQWNPDENAEKDGDDVYGEDPVQISSFASLTPICSSATRSLSAGPKFSIPRLPSSAQAQSPLHSNDTRRAPRTENIKSHKCMIQSKLLWLAFCVRTRGIARNRRAIRSERALLIGNVCGRALGRKIVWLAH